MSVDVIQPDGIEPTAGVRRALIVLSGIGGSAVYEFTWSIAGVALPHMQGSFSATPDQIAWVMTAFIMGTVITIACTGWLSARFGTKRVFLTSIAGFGASLFMCGIATTLHEEIVWRLIQGVFGATLLPLGQSITVAAYPPDRHGAATAIWTIGVIGGGIMGPIIGGGVVEFMNWPWIFFLNLPIAFVAFFVALAVLPDTKPDPDVHLDAFGLATIVVAATAFQVFFARGERLDWFSSGEIIIEGAIGVLALYLFVVHSLTTDRSFFRPALFRDRNYSLGLIAAFANGAIATLPLVILPIMLEQMAGYPVFETGILLFPRGIGLIIVSLVLARYDRHLPPRFVLLVGLALTLVSTYAMIGWTANVSATEVMWANLVQGAGGAAMFISINALAFSTLKTDLKTEGFALYYTVLFAGATIGIATIVGVLTRMTQVATSVVGAHVNPFNERFRILNLPEIWDHTETTGLAALQQEVAVQAQMISYSDSFIAAAAISLIALPLVFLFRDPTPQH
jgi:MFS transporter, DHA2 family, multidrug resistance protein